MEIQKISADKMKLSKYNPRKDLKPGDPVYEKLKRSIQEFGYVEPVIWNKRTGNIVGGHQRYKVLVELGYESIDSVVVDLSAKDEKTLNVALNKITGEFDIPLLTDLLKDLSSDPDFDLTLTGFELDEIDGFFDMPEQEYDDNYYSGKNKEIADFENGNYFIKLVYPEKEYEELLDRMRDIDTEPEKIFYDAIMAVSHV